MNEKKGETQLMVPWNTVFQEWFIWAMIAGLFLLAGWWIPNSWMVSDSPSDPGALSYPAFYDWTLIAIGVAAICAVVAALQKQRRSLRVTSRRIPGFPDWRVGRRPLVHPSFGRRRVPGRQRRPRLRAHPGCGSHGDSGATADDHAVGKSFAVTARPRWQPGQLIHHLGYRPPNPGHALAIRTVRRVCPQAER